MMKLLCAFLLSAGLSHTAIATCTFNLLPLQGHHEVAHAPKKQVVTHQISGRIRMRQGMELTIQTRAGKTMRVDVADAIRNKREIALAKGSAITVDGTIDHSGILHAESIQHAKDSSAAWPPDR